MPADVELNVRVSKKGDGADKVARDLKQMARAADEAGDQLGQVERKLIEIKALSAAAGKQFLETGDISPLKQLVKDEKELKLVQKSLQGVIDEEKKLAAEAENAAKSVAGGAESAAASGEKAAKSLSDAILDAAGDLPAGIGKAISFGVANPEIGAAGAGIAAALVAGASATISGAALATTAAAALAGGILLAAQSRDVHQAWAAFATQAGDELTQASTPLVAPLADAAHTLGDAVHAEVPSLQKDFASLAPVVGDLASGVAGLIREIDPGLSRGIQAGAVVLDRVANELPDLGAALGDLFDELGRSAQGGGDALITTFKALEFTIEGLGVSLHNATTAFALFAAPLQVFTDQLSNANVAGVIFGSGLVEIAGHLLGLDDNQKQTAKSTEELFHKQQDAADAAKKQADEEKRLAEEARYAKQALKELQDFVSSEADKLLGAQEAQLNFNASLNSLKETLKANKGAFDEHSKAGIQDHESLIAAAQAAVELRNRTLDLTHNTEAADAAFQGAIKQVRETGKQMGLTDAQIDGVIGSLRGLRSPPPIIVDLKRLGYTDGEIETLKDRIGNLHNKLTTIQIDYISRHIDVFGTGIGGLGHLGGQAKGGVILRAAQGLVSGILPPRSPGTMVLAGEPQTGGEVFAPLKGISQSRAMALAGVIGDAYGFDVGGRGGSVTGRSGGSRVGGAPVLSYSGSTGGLDGLFLSWLQKQIRTGRLKVDV